jgi:hypothetical protein
MGSRSRKRRRIVTGDALFAPREIPAAEATRPKRLRGQAAEDAARAELRPLAEGERPRAVTAAAIVATVAVPANLLASVIARDPTAAQTRFTIIQCLVLAVAAFGLWRSRYWAVLGFQILLALTCVIGAGMIALASNVLGAIVGLVLLVAAGTLFWFLVRAMARIQMPRRPGA